MGTIERIFMLMEQKNVSAARLTREADLSAGLLTQWKQKKQKPGTDAIVKIADYFDVSTDFLLGKTNNPAAQTQIDIEGIDFAFYSDFKELTDERKDAVRRFAKFMREEDE